MSLATKLKLIEALKQNLPTTEHLTFTYSEDTNSFSLRLGRNLTSLLEDTLHYYKYPIDTQIINSSKFTKKTGKTELDLQRDLHYHWITNFNSLSTKEQIITAIQNPETCGSLATAIAVNKYIEAEELSEKESKELFKGSHWRWIKTPQNEYIQATFYPLAPANEILIIIGYNYPNLLNTNKLTSLKSFSYWINNKVSIEESRPRQLLPHSTKATDTFKFKFEPKEKLTKTPLYLGIELELEGHSNKEYKTLDSLKQHAIFKTDGSLQEGVEICTAPATIGIHKEEFKTFFAKLRENKSKLKDTASCGLHIHIDKKTISKLHLANLYLLINNKENASQIKKIAGRSPNRYCENHEVDYGHFTQDYKESATKYRQVNLVPRDTIELRLFASTIDYQLFSQRLEFAQAIIDYTRPGEVNIPVHKIPLWENFTNYILKHTKFYPELALTFGHTPKSYQNTHI